MKLTTAGESHGKALIAVIEGLPAHLKLDIEKINAALAYRQSENRRGVGSSPKWFWTWRKTEN